MSEMIEGETGRYDIDRLKEAIFDVIDYHRQEYKFTYAEVIGVLEIIQLGLVAETGALDNDEED